MSVYACGFAISYLFFFSIIYIEPVSDGNDDDDDDDESFQGFKLACMEGFLKVLRYYSGWLMDG